MTAAGFRAGVERGQDGARARDALGAILTASFQ